MEEKTPLEVQSSPKLLVILTGILSVGYIVVVNAAIMSTAGFAATSVAIATGLVTLIATLGYAIIVKRPWLVSCGMGLNLILAGLAVKGATPSQILGIAIASGVVTLLLAMFLAEKIKAWSRGILGTAMVATLCALLSHSAIPNILQNNSSINAGLLIVAAVASVLLVEKKMSWGFLLGPVVAWVLADHSASPTVSTAGYAWIAPSFDAVPGFFGLVVTLALVDTLDTATFYHILSLGDPTESQRRTRKSVAVGGIGTMIAGLLGTTPTVLFAENLGIKTVSGGIPWRWSGVVIAVAIAILGFIAGNLPQLALPAIGTVAILQIALLMGKSAFPFAIKATRLEQIAIVIAIGITLATGSFAKGLAIPLILVGLEKVIEDRKLTWQDLDMVAFVVAGVLLFM
jgi:AGZA family xanthine/uracil permease-like MFS transporter